MGTLTPNRFLPVPTVGGDAGPLFAEEVNAAITDVDSITGGVNVLNVGGNANVTLTNDQSQNMVQQFTGVLTGNITVFAPAVGAFYAVENATTGNFSLAFGCAGGGNVQIIPSGLSTWLWTDGSFTRLSNPPGWQEIATYTASGASSLVITLPGPFRRFRLTMDFTVSSPNANLDAAFSNDGGATFVSSGYFTTASVWYGTTVTAGSFSGGYFAISMPTNPGQGYDGTMEIYPGAGGVNIRSNGIGFDAQVGSVAGENRVGTNGNILNANAMLVNTGGAGTFSGTFILEGLP